MRRSLVKSNVRCRARQSSTTPRLDAKWAGRDWHTLTNSSRISWVSWASWASVRLCKSAGQVIRGRTSGIETTPLGLPVAGHDEPGEGSEPFPGRPERLRGGLGVGRELRRQPPALVHADQPGVGYLPPGRVLADRLPGRGTRPGRVEQVVRHLEQQAESRGEVVRRL